MSPSARAQAAEAIYSMSPAELRRIWPELSKLLVKPVEVSPARAALFVDHSSASVRDAGQAVRSS